MIFLSVYFSYLLLVLEPLHLLVIGPLLAAQPARRRDRLRRWIRIQTQVLLALARTIAGVRISVQGSIDPTSCIVVMNHQSILDIPVGLSLIAGPPPRALARLPVEEDVHELPQQVVVGLHELLADERVAHRRHRRADLEAALSGTAASSASNTSTMSSGPASSASSSGLVNPIAGSARLPTITGWTNSTATWRASERAAGEAPSATSRPPRAKRSAIAVAEPRDAGRPRRRRSAGSRRCAPRAAPRACRSSPRRGSSRRARPARERRTSQSRSSSTPSPVRALTSMRGTPGCTRVRGGRGTCPCRSRGARAGRPC